MEPITLKPATIDVWSAWLTQPPWPSTSLERVLSFEEQGKASGFAHLADRQGAVVSRGLLRFLLAAYLRYAPEAIPLLTAAHGKPHIAEAFNPHGLEFSVAHTKRLVVFAVAQGFPVGIDVEFVDRLSTVWDLVISAFCAAEYATWCALPLGEQRRAAISAWTAKEAVFKAAGSEGLRSFRDIEVAIGGDGPLLLRLGETVQQPPTWRLVECAPAPGYIGTLCYPAAFPCSIRQQWMPREETPA